MLGTHVHDDAWDFGSPDHNHHELHPLYVIQPCMGGWFHFAVSESIAIAPDAARCSPSPVRPNWPWTAMEPGVYRAKYIELNPHRCRDELALTYNLLLEWFRSVGDEQGAARFFAEASVRYERLGVDTGESSGLSPETYRVWALEQIRGHRSGVVRNMLVDRLDRLFRFLHGPASYALSPAKGPAPHAFLRCAYAVDATWAAEATSGAVGEPNPRVSLNRATARALEVFAAEWAALYRHVFTAIEDASARAQLFTQAAIRYRNWAVSSGLASDAMTPEQLFGYASTQTADGLAEEMAARIGAFVALLTPHLKK
jgi:hypothetical protein